MLIVFDCILYQINYWWIGFFKTYIYILYAIDGPVTTALMLQIAAIGVAFGKFIDTLLLIILL